MGIRSDISGSRQSGSEAKELSIVDGAVFILCFVYSFWCVGERLVARDEGFYTYAAQLLLEGQHPYIDFFYPQMPLLPYVYALGGLLGGTTWGSYRAVSALLFGGILLFSYGGVAVHRGRVWAIVALFLVSFCHLSFEWFPVVQTYALSVFLLLVSITLLSLDSQKRWTAFSVGLFFALTVQTRLFFAPLIVVPLLTYYFSSERRKLLPRFFYGLVVGSVPSVIFIGLNPDSYFFSNLGYHLIRSSQTLSEEVEHKWRIFEVLFSLGRPSQKFDSFQTPFIFGGMFVALFLSFRLQRAARIFVSVAVLLFLVSFLPNPTYVQYFVSVVPFAIAGVIIPLASFYRSQTRLGAKLIIAIGILFGAIYLKDVPGDMERYFKTGQGVIGIGGPSRAVDWNIPRVVEVGKSVERLCRVNEEVLALWPGYLIGAHRRAVPKTENHFGFRAAEQLSDEEQDLFHVISVDRVSMMIKNRKIACVVGHKSAFRPQLREALAKAGYAKAKNVGGVYLYRVSPKAPSENS
ncbi:MAG: hypothetical protein KDD70_00665 [Bdellovibrionales bacterium]|nr:hypothetical protein [Bdellovibrionales bacterium]